VNSRLHDYSLTSVLRVAAWAANVNRGLDEGTRGR
jgi:hypothetical protein